MDFEVNRENLSPFELQREKKIIQENMDKLASLGLVTYLLSKTKCMRLASRYYTINVDWHSLLLFSSACTRT